MHSSIIAGPAEMKDLDRRYEKPSFAALQQFVSVR
jgi:hypothetical protein